MKLYMVVAHVVDPEEIRYAKVFFFSRYADAIELCELTDRCAYSYELYKYISRLRRYREIMRG